MLQGRATGLCSRKPLCAQEGHCRVACAARLSGQGPTGTGPSQPVVVSDMQARQRVPTVGCWCGRQRRGHRTLLPRVAQPTHAALRRRICPASGRGGLGGTWGAARAVGCWGPGGLSFRRASRGTHTPSSSRPPEPSSAPAVWALLSPCACGRARSTPARASCAVGCHSEEPRATRRSQAHGVT